jgi:hypothetical protein
VILFDPASNTNQNQLSSTENETLTNCAMAITTFAWSKQIQQQSIPPHLRLVMVGDSHMRTFFNAYYVNFAKSPTRLLNRSVNRKRLWWTRRRVPNSQQRTYRMSIVRSGTLKKRLFTYSIVANIPRVEGTTRRQVLMRNVSRLSGLI